jgi:hypothetical protein
MEDVGYIIWPFALFYGHLIYFTPIWYIFGTLVYFFRFGTLYHERSGNPGPRFQKWSTLRARKINIFRRFFGRKNTLDFAAGLPDGTHIFVPKISLWVKFRESCYGPRWYILRPVGLFYYNLVYL